MIKIAMSYIDYHLASLEEREKFSFTKDTLRMIYKKLFALDGVDGVVIVSTCNRTEVYFSYVDTLNITPFQALCQAIELDYNRYDRINRTLYGKEVVHHICQLSSGVKSQIWGEDQIVSQVKDSILFAREEQTTNSTLEVLFRIGVSAGKRVKTDMNFKADNNSTASKSVEIINAVNSIKKVLVIGNGAIGRLVAELLVKSGVETIMTLRQYKHSEVIVPAGVTTCDYDNRYEVMQGCDGVISATLSPHHTVKYDKILDLTSIPQVFIDLAVPRDIDPLIYAIDGVNCYNIDDISHEEIEHIKAEQLEKVNSIIAKYEADFVKWYSFKWNINKDNI